MTLHARSGSEAIFRDQASWNEDAVMKDIIFDIIGYIFTNKERYFVHFEPEDEKLKQKFQNKFQNIARTIAGSEKDQ